jgi:Cu/Zn superoxide dismutase
MGSDHFHMGDIGNLDADKDGQARLVFQLINGVLDVMIL